MPDKIPRKTERSHEENQERAYVAASRRADRSIEARVQSARMASEIHKKRTGKGFRITEEIVMKEEMYEEEDDDLPRSYRLLGAHMQTPQEMNLAVEAYFSNRVAMSSLLDSSHEDWREHAINKLFDQSFPHANLQAQQLSHHMPMQQMHSMYYGPTVPEALPQNGMLAPSFQPVTYHSAPPQYHHERRHSIPVVSPTEFIHRDETLSPLADTPGSNSETPRTRASMTPNTPLDMGPSPSAFTPPVLPLDASKMAMREMFASNNDVYNAQNWTGPEMYYNASEIPGPMKMEDPQNLLPPEYCAEDMAHLNLEPLTQNPNVEDEAWETFINDSAWVNDQ